jgi:serine protease Do
MDADPHLDVLRNTDSYKALMRRWRGKMLGIDSKNLTPDEAAKLSLPAGRGGLRINTVKAGGAAEKAGLQVGDVILEVDGQALRLEGTFDHLRDVLGLVKDDVDVAIVLLRGTQRMTLKARWASPK